MEEMKPNKKPAIMSLVIMIVIFALLNIFFYNNVVKRQYLEVGYNVFMQMIDEKEIAEANIQSNQIIFSDKNGNLYKTGIVADAELYERLYESGATFGAEIIEQTNPILYYLVTFLIYALFLFIVWKFISKKMLRKMGDSPDTMSFGMGKSNARVYVKSDTGIKFKDVAG